MSSTLRDSAPTHLVTLSGDAEKPDPRSTSAEYARQSSTRRRLLTVDWTSRLPTYVGIAMVIVGFALIAVAWALVAGEGDVAFQIPYVVSAGFTGLGLIMCGLVIVNIAAKRQDAAERADQIAQLADLLRDAQRALADEEDVG